MAGASSIVTSIDSNNNFSVTATLTLPDGTTPSFSRSWPGAAYTHLFAMTARRMAASFLINGIGDPMSTPTAVTAAGALTAGVYTFGFSWTSASGESAVSPTGTITTGGTGGIKVSISAVPPLNVTGVKYYLSIAAGNATMGYVLTQTVTGNTAVPDQILNALGNTTLPLSVSTLVLPGDVARMLSDVYIGLIYTGPTAVSPSVTPGTAPSFTN